MKIPKLERSKNRRKDNDNRSREWSHSVLSTRHSKYTEDTGKIAELKFYMHASGIFVDVNEQVFNLFGLYSHEVIGCSFTDIDVFDREESTKLADLFMGILNSDNNESSQVKVKAKHSDGSEFFVSVLIKAVNDIEGNNDGFIGIISRA